MIKLKNYFEIGKKKLLQRNSAEVLSQDYSLRQLGAKSSLSSFLPVQVRVHIYKSIIIKKLSTGSNKNSTMYLRNIATPWTMNISLLVIALHL